MTAGPVSRARDYMALVKPRINAMALGVAAVALVLAPGDVSPARSALALGAIALVVGAANALNMYFERDTDSLMERTRMRPLPAGRLSPPAAAAFGVLLAAVALPILWIVANPLTALLSIVALVNYVFIYTPLKRRTSWALLVGAISGAMPVLMGWTAVTGRIDAAAAALFLVLFAWQVPHFLAISLFRQHEYAAAGIKVVPLALGERATRVQAVLSTGVLLAATLLPIFTGPAGLAYAVTAAAVGAWFAGLSLRGLREAAGAAWARGFFRASLAYVPALMAALLVDAVLR